MPRRHFGIIPVCFVLVGSILSILIYAHWKQHLPRSSLIMPATRSKIKNQRRWITADPVFYSASLRPRLLSRHKTTLLTTKKCSRYYHLLILVASAPDNFDRRNNIRKTWARDTELHWPRWKTYFLLGQTPTSNVSKLLLKEDEAFRDLVRGDYKEHYWNQTYKIQMGFEWAVKYCEFSFLLKADDDVFVDTARVISYLNEPDTPKLKLYSGHVMRQVAVTRKLGKWFVSKSEYARNIYPDYCSGFAYILSYDVVTLFVELFEFLPVFKIDDAYVGMLAEQTGVRAMQKVGFETWPREETLCIPLTDTLARHRTLGKCLIELYNRTVIDRMYFL